MQDGILSVEVVYSDTDFDLDFKKMDKVDVSIYSAHVCLGWTRLREESI